MTRRRRAAACALALVGLSACKLRSTSPDEGTRADAASTAARPVRAPCAPAGPALALGVDGDVSFGAAAVSARGAAVGLVHQGRDAPLAAVALLPPDGSRVRLVDLGPCAPDDPPPPIAWRSPDSDELVAISPEPARDPKAPRGVGVVVLHGEDAPRPLLRMLDAKGDDGTPLELAVSGSRILFAWDAAVGGASRGGMPRGVVRAAAFEGPSRLGEPRDVSPADEDASDARAVGGGPVFFVLWAASRADDGGVSGGHAGTAAGSEPRSARWLEVVVLDARGAPVTSPKRLTSSTDRLASFDVQLDPSTGAAAPASALIVARVDRAGSEGGVLERLRVLADGTSEAALELGAGELGSGPPMLVGGPLPWVAWAGVREEVVLLPLDAEGRPAGPPADEDAFGSSQPIGALPGSRILAAVAAGAVGAARGPGGSGGAGGTGGVRGESSTDLRVFSCPR